MSRIAVAFVVLMLGACGGSGGPATVASPPVPPTPSGEYTGPPPATADVQSFKINLWDNVRTDNRCGQCHFAGGQSPSFARFDDVNMAYAEANTVVDLPSPVDSRIVTKVAGGHNCWLASSLACEDILVTWISAWSGELAAGGSRTIEFRAPEVREVGTSKSFPGESDLFATHVHPMLEVYCSQCHSAGAAIPQSPFFADSDVAAAYAAVQSKIDLDTPRDSRLVVRLRDEFHNCWSNCSDDATDMLDAIVAMADLIDPTEVDPFLVISKAMRLTDGLVASGGNRYEANTIALYEFKEGTGTTAFDTSGVEPALHLNLSGATDWVGGWGVQFSGGKAQAPTAASRKLKDLIGGTGEYSIEAWAVPGNVTQEDARIISYSAGNQLRNFTLGQTLYNYDFFNRSSLSDANGAPALSTADADEDLQATLQHVVVTYDPVNGRNIYVNAAHTGDVDDGGGSIADWDDTFAFVLGNEVSGDRPWLGTLRLVAVHNRVLNADQIQQNFDAGVGEKFLVLFNVTDLVGLPDSYVYFEVSQFDSYAYLFAEPAFISLDETVTPDGIPIEGLRIGVNGEEASTGQAWSRLATALDAASYTDVGQGLSPLGTIIALEKGPDSDEFFLSFDRIGDQTFVRTPGTYLSPPPVDAQVPAPQLGLRTFDEINATMANVTGVSRQLTDVVQTFANVRQQLPVNENIEGFLAAHQVGVAQLAIEYCNALIDDVSLRSSVFPSFNFATPASEAYDTEAERDALIDPLLDRLAAASLTTQPVPADVKAEMAALSSRLTACGAGCPSDRTETTAKGLCAALVGSAVMLVQ